MRNKLMMTVAAAALVAGAGIASAQMQPMQKGGERPDTPGAGSMQQPGSNAEERGKADDRTKPGAAQPQRQQGAQPQQGTQKPAQGAQREDRDQRPQGAQREQRPGATGAQPGQAGSASVTLNAEQKTRIRQTVIQSSGAPRVSNVNFSLNVGTVVPRERVRLVAVPPTLVEIHPAWRGYLYFIVGDELIIVEPSSHRIVAVVSV